ncbi:MAG: hypothetical protein GY841_21390 [FCB group bacterium]|nr:hypothetical protein [FCB group bacterium]
MDQQIKTVAEKLVNGLIFGWDIYPLVELGVIKRLFGAISAHKDKGRMFDPGALSGADLKRRRPKKEFNGVSEQEPQWLWPIEAIWSV